MDVPSLPINFDPKNQEQSIRAIAQWIDQLRFLITGSATAYSPLTAKLMTVLWPAGGLGKDIPPGWHRCDGLKDTPDLTAFEFGNMYYIMRLF